MGCANSKTAAATSTTQPAVIGERPSNVFANKPTLTLPPAPPVAAVPPPVYKPTTAAPNVYKPTVAPTVYKPPAAPTAPKKHESEAKDVTSTPEKPLDINHLDLSGMSPAVAAICQDSIHLINAMYQHSTVDPAKDCKEAAEKYFSQGKFQEAFKQYEFALTIRKSKLGTYEHGLVADSYAQMGVSRRLQGYFDLAWKLTMQALQMRRKLFGEKSEPVSESHGHLGDLLVDMGNHRDAKLQYKLAVDIREGAGDKMSPITAKYLANMGNCHRVLQNYEAAFSLLERARLSLELFLGPEDLATLAVFFNLAMVGQKQKTGKYEQALEYHIKVLGPREDKFGKDHPIISDSYMNIGLCKIGQGRLNECMDCFNLALKIRHSKLGNDDPETAECKAKVGLGFAAQKQYENSLVYCYQAEITLEKTVGPNHVYSYGLYINMADCFRAQSEYTDALKYYNKAQDMALVVFGGRSVQVSTGRILMGQTKLEARDISGALELFRQAHKTDLVVRPTEINTINTGILIQQIERSVNNARAEQQGRGIPNGVGSTALSQ